MKPSPGKKGIARHISEFLGAVSMLVFSTVPSFLAFAMKIFEMYGKFIFIPTWGLDFISNIARTLAVAWSPNKNIQRIAGVAMSWLGFTLSTLMMFCTAYIGATASFALIITMVVMTPFPLFVKTAWYAIKGFRCEDAEERKKHFDTAKGSLKEAILMSLGAAMFGALALVPGLPAAASITLGVILTVLMVPLTIKALASKLREFTHWIQHKLTKRYEKKNGLRDPELAIKPALRSKAASSENPDSLPDANFHFSLHERIDNHIATLQKQIQDTEGTFQKSKRLNKVDALKMLKQVLLQWDDAFIDGLRTNPSVQNSSIDLGKAFIDNVPNVHTNQYAARNKEKLIKRIKQHLFEQYPDAFQSFFEEKGQVELLFDEAFDCIRTMKSQQEIRKETDEIQKEIAAYRASHCGFFSKFNTTQAKAEREESMQYLEKRLDGTYDDDTPAPAAVLKEHSQRNRLFQKISSLSKSQRTLCMAQINAGVDEEKNLLCIKL